MISPFASYELSLALTLTGRSATAYLDFAVELVSRLPKTLAALEAGQIDIIRARIIAEATHMLSGEHAAAVEDRDLPPRRAADQRAAAGGPGPRGPCRRSRCGPGPAGTGAAGRAGAALA